MRVLRKIIRINEQKCTGCGLCVNACAEGAIELVDGKARLVSETYCDGLAACIGSCPEGAIEIEEREAEPFDREAVSRRASCPIGQEEKAPSACPGMTARRFTGPAGGTGPSPSEPGTSALAHWPVQLRLVAPNAQLFQGADLLLVADCVPFALADFHSRFLRGRAVAVGCPKLDDAHYYVEKLTEILEGSGCRSLTVVHMEVPCCSGLTRIAEAALGASGADVPARDVTVSVDGRLIRDEEIPRVPAAAPRAPDQKAQLSSACAGRRGPP